MYSSAWLWYFDGPEVFGSIKKHEVFGSNKNMRFQERKHKNGSIKAHEVWGPSNDMRFKILSQICGVHHTQPDLTLFYLIFTYLGGRYLWSFRNYGSNVALYNYFLAINHLRWLQTLFWIIWKKLKGAQKIFRTNTKTLISSIWIRPQGSQGCQKMRQGQLNTPFEVWCTKVAPKLKNIWNTLRKQGFFYFFFCFDNFSKFVPFGGNLSARTQQFYL